MIEQATKMQAEHVAVELGDATLAAGSRAHVLFGARALQLADQ
jgi:hypothetical protein